ncbi:hypothetical protein Y032_0174g456 [Ancylostoma ceylanicum]|uniref:Uncharacterized protein n=1 Tax=Ancylostoma ceylanicum TaxID=53326 RepID=A0A016SU16_9BILA|nr:hypothetical protein Y032_0174g456 [Ancylostoma ceylanicum]
MRSKCESSGKERRRRVGSALRPTPTVRDERLEENYAVGTASDGADQRVASAVPVAVRVHADVRFPPATSRTLNMSLSCTSRSGDGRTTHIDDEDSVVVQVTPDGVQVDVRWYAVLPSERPLQRLASSADFYSFAAHT